MSDNQVSVGLVAPLNTPISKDKYDEVSQFLESADLFINYDGTLIFMQVKKMASYNFDMQIGRPENPDTFAAICKVAGYPIQSHNCESYVAHWYDGSDSPMSTLTLENYNV